MKTTTRLMRVDSRFKEFVDRQTELAKNSKNKMMDTSAKVTRQFVRDAETFWQQQQANAVVSMGIAFAIILLGVIAIGFFAYILTSILDGVSGSIAGNAAQPIVQDWSTLYKGLGDTFLIGTFFALWFGSVIASIIRQENPLFFIIFLSISTCLFLLIMPVSVYVGDVAREPTGLGDFITTNFPMTMFLVNNIGVLFVFFLVTHGVALYARSRFQSVILYGGG